MTEKAPAVKKRGRPAAPPEARRGHNLTFRIRSDLRDKLEERARGSGRSISEEVERIISTDIGLQRDPLPISPNADNNPIIDRKNTIALAINDYFVLQNIIERATMDLGQLSNVCQTPGVHKSILALMHYYFVFRREIPEHELQAQYKDACIDEYVQDQLRNNPSSNVTKNDVEKDMREVEQQAEKDREAADLAYMDIVREKISSRPLQKWKTAK